MNSNMTPRSGKHANFPKSEGIIAAGMQKTTRQMHWDWNDNFFNRPIEEIDQFQFDLTAMLMKKEPINVDHMKELHKIGHLPIRFKAIKEGTFMKYKIPMYTIQNTVPLTQEAFDWLVNYLETILSAESWQMPTSATLAREFRKLSKEWITKTDVENLWMIDYQNHDFSMRGMGGKSAIVNSGLGFAFGSRGSDTLPVIPASRKYYDYPTDQVPINSVVASEHAIMCSLTGFFLQQKDGTWDRIGELEVETFSYLLKTFPDGILSLVSDTWDLWRVITEYCEILKEEILARDGKLVIRPDSGDPVDIICGTGTSQFEDMSRWIDKDAEITANMFEDSLLESAREDTPHGEHGPTEWTGYYQIHGRYYEATINNISWNRHDKQYYFIDMWETAKIDIKEIDPLPEHKGVIELLWDIFHGDINDQGYKRLNSHIGAIYGDSITLDRASRIYQRLADKGFASTNIVLGIGSYSLQCVTRDTHGFAQKATYIELGEGEGIEIFKDPITDDGIKKSAKGLLRVDLVDGEYVLKDQCTKEEEEGGELQIIYENGEFFNQTTLEEIRERFNATI
jgi:nicotinamide phosphoribosyltransferase